VHIERYLANKPLLAAGIWEDNAREAERWPAKYYFEGNCGILRTIFQPRLL